MTGRAPGGRDIELTTPRLVLRPWRAEEAVVQHQLWAERDARVPAHRRLDAHGRPTVADLARLIRARPSTSVERLAVVRSRTSGGHGLGLEHGVTAPVG